MEHCDVVVVGGGPGGSSCARRLRGAGLNVIVIDRRTFPRDKLCAGWITPQVVHELDLDLDAYAAGGRTLQPIRGFSVARMGDPAARVEYDEVVSWGIRRCELDHYLLERSGATLRPGEPVRELERGERGWVVNGSLGAPVVVGAGGHFCPVGRMLGGGVGEAEQVVAAQEIEFELEKEEARRCPVQETVPEIWFTRDLKGYGWIFRKGRWVNIGLGRQDKHRLGEHVREFLDFLARLGKLPRLPARLRGHPYLLYGQAPRPLYGHAALLVGDAAGMAYAKSGEGIRPAIESGILAAETLLDCEGDYRADRLAEYERRVVSRFGPRRSSRGITDLLPLPLAGALAGRLFAMPWFARRIVLDRWFFHRETPALAPVAEAADPLPALP